MPSALETPSDASFHRQDFSDVEQYLKNLGATHVIPYEDLFDGSASERVESWTGGKVYIDSFRGFIH